MQLQFHKHNGEEADCMDSDHLLQHQHFSTFLSLSLSLSLSVKYCIMTVLYIPILRYCGALGIRTATLTQALAETNLERSDILIYSSLSRSSPMGDAQTQMGI